MDQQNNQQNNNNEDGNWGCGLMAIAAIPLVIVGLNGGFGAILLIIFAIGFFKWFWFS